MHDVVAYHTYLLKKICENSSIELQLQLCPYLRMLEEPDIMTKIEILYLARLVRSGRCTYKQR